MGLLTRNSWVERREPRTKVLIAIQLRGDGLVADACLRDVSSRGVLVQTSRPPARGAIVELVGPFQPVVARVVWTNGRRFGAELREHLNVKALTTGRLDRRTAGGTGIRPCGGPERRKAKSSEHHVRISSWLQKGAVLVIGAGVAIGMTLIVYDSLAEATQSIRSGLEAKPNG